MNYKQWGAEYLEEAEQAERSGLFSCGGNFTACGDEEAILLSRRIAVLYDMYLECLHTGRLLDGKGKSQ